MSQNLPIPTTQNIIDLSNGFLSASYFAGDISIGIISLFSSGYKNTTISGVSLTTRKILISSLLELQDSLFLTSEIINPNYLPIPLTLQSLGMSFYEVYKAAKNISTAFTQLFLQLLNNVNQAARSAYHQTSTDIQAITSTYQQSVISLKSIIRNFNSLSSQLLSLSTIIGSIDFITADNLVLAKALNAAAHAASKISSEFNIFYTDFYIVSTTFIPGKSVANQLNLIPLSFSVFSIAFQQAYLACTQLSITPNPVSSLPLSIAFNNVYMDILNISNLFNNQNLVQNSIFNYLTDGLIQIIQIGYNQLALIFQYLITPTSNSELFNYLYYNAYIENILFNIYNVVIAQLQINYSDLSLSNDIFNQISIYYQDASDNILNAINNLNDIKFLFNSNDTMKNILLSTKTSLFYIGGIFSNVIQTNSLTDIINDFNEINLYHEQIYIEFLLLANSVMYIVPKPLSINYPILNPNSSALNIFSNDFNSISTYTQKIAQDFENIFGNLENQTQFFQNIINGFYILSEIYLQISINVHSNLTMQDLYESTYQIYFFRKIISSSLTSLYNNINLIDNTPILNSSLQNLLTNMSNILTQDSLIGDIIPSLNLPSSLTSILSLCFSLISEPNANLFNESLPHNLINILDIRFKQYTAIHYVIFNSIYYLSVNVPILSSPTSFSSSLSLVATSCKNISLAYSSMQNIISLNPDNSLFNFNVSILNYNVLYYLFNNASNATSETDLANAFKQIYNIFLNEQEAREINLQSLNVIPINNIFSNNNSVLYSINNLITQYNVLSSSLNAASSAIDILEFTIQHPSNLSFSLAAASSAITEISNAYDNLITNLSSSSDTLFNSFSNVINSMSDLTDSFNQAYISISNVSAETYDSVLAFNAPFPYNVIPN